MNSPRFIDLFAGIGGFRIAFEGCGCRCVFSSEKDPACRETYRRNYGETPAGDITAIVADEIPDFDILCAGFPCQPFSISGKKLGFADTRGTMFFEICRIIKEKSPGVVVLENVKHILAHDGGNTFKVILSALSELGYTVSHRVLNSVDFGVAQSRERVIAVGVRDGLPEFDFGALHTSGRTAIRDILDGEGEFEWLGRDEYTLLPADMVRTQKSGMIFAGYRNGSIWRNGTRPGTEHLSRCHRQPDRIYSVDGTHPTLSSQETTGRFWIYIPEADAVRKLTVGECYRLMGFPGWFSISPRKSDAYRQCGNSVAIPMVESLAKALTERYFN